jgi:hypothetical protein
VVERESAPGRWSRSCSGRSWTATIVTTPSTSLISNPTSGNDFFCSISDSITRFLLPLLIWGRDFQLGFYNTMSIARRATKLLVRFSFAAIRTSKYSSAIHRGFRPREESEIVEPAQNGWGRGGVAYLQGGVVDKLTIVSLLWVGVGLGRLIPIRLCSAVRGEIPRSV